MILADLENFRGLGKEVRLILIEKVKELLVKYRGNLDEVYTLYDENQINNALSKGITLTGNYIFMKTNGLSGKILRTLEYGTGRTKALHIITEATRLVIGGMLR